MKNNLEKPSPEAKALSLFLMAFKKSSPIYKTKSKRISKLWNLVVEGRLSVDNYAKEVENMLKSFGGYAVVVEKTVRFYIDKTGEWKSQGEDKYGIDSQQIADEILNA